jgi:hypothetical protein
MLLGSRSQTKEEMQHPHQGAPLPTPKTPHSPKTSNHVTYPKGERARNELFLFLPLLDNLTKVMKLLLLLLLLLE